MARFVAILTFGDRERRLEVRPQHREYLASLHAQGKLHESGPFADEAGALIIYEAGDDAEVRLLIEQDPYSKAGVIDHLEIREWRRIIPAN
ncbi:MAG: YciI family protein [Thermomicrobiales bacterium]